MKLSKLLQEAVGKLTQKEPAPFRKPTAKDEKHNPDFVQSEPVAFKKPKEAPAVDAKPTAEKEQKAVIKRNEEQAEISAASADLSDILESILAEAGEEKEDDKEEEPKTPTDKFTSVSGGPPAPKTPGASAPTTPGAAASGASDATEQAHKLGLTAKAGGRWYDKSGKYVAKTVQGKLVKVAPDASNSPDMGDDPRYPGEMAQKKSMGADAFNAMIQGKAGTSQFPGEDTPENREKMAAALAGNKPQPPKGPHPKEPNGGGEETGRWGKEPSSKLSDMIPADDALYNRPPSKSGITISPEQVARVGELVKTPEGAAGILKKVDPMKRKQTYRILTGAAHEAIAAAGGLVGNEVSDTNKYSDYLYDTGYWDELLPDIHPEARESFLANDPENLDYVDACFAVAEDLNNGIDPASNPKTVELYEDWVSSLQSDASQYQEQMEADAEEEGYNKKLRRSRGDDHPSMTAWERNR